jgi:glutathione peroxidase
MIKVLLVLNSLLYLTSIYSFKVTDIANGEIDFETFRNKKILIVNISTAGPKVGQLQALEELHQLYKDSLIVIAFPSNSFGNTPESNSAIENLLQTNYETKFLLASKVDVNGASTAPIYHWLTTQSENGMLSNPVVGDFQKFLINKSGKLVGVFSPIVDPMDSLIQNAIRENNL